jgi:hypothetical protein
MKTRIAKYLFLVFFLGLVLSKCTHDDQVIIPVDPTPADQNELISAKTTTPPDINGVIETTWDAAKAIQFKAVVPDPGNDVFKGYVGDAYTVKMRSLYDATNIYFLAEWDDPNLSVDRQTWYFDPGEKRWNQENRYPTFNAAGVQTRAPFYEDKFAFLWNVNNSVPNFSCYATCHTGLSAADGFARHYTNSASEFVDMWHWKLVRTNVNVQFDDQFQDNTQPNGRKSDDKISGGYSDNIQDLMMTGTTTSVKVPKYFIPGKSYYAYITQTEIDAGTAKEITAVDTNGLLSYSGGMIDPYAEVGFQREGSTTGPFGIPSIYTQPFVGSRGDITAKGVYTGSGWVLEVSRKLSTGDASNQDINFGDLSDQPFGIGVFDNAALAHAIKTGLTLKFEK